LYSVAITEEHLTNQKLYLNQRLCALHPVQIKSQFLSIALKDSRLLENIYAKSTGTANQANIGMEAISNWVIPLPPINEQLRILGTVSRLLALCEQAKLDIAKAEKTKISLANAIVEKALD
jgi:type I restriction enzyme S subunit